MYYLHERGLYWVGMTTAYDRIAVPTGRVTSGDCLWGGGIQRHGVDVATIIPP